MSADWELVGWDLSGVSRDETYLGLDWQQRRDEIVEGEEGGRWRRGYEVVGEDDTSGGGRLAKLNTRDQIGISIKTCST
jgi:hypothetical protein